MQVYREKNKTTVGTMEIQKLESLKFLSNRVVVMVAVHTTI